VPLIKLAETGLRNFAIIEETISEDEQELSPKCPQRS